MGPHPGSRSQAARVHHLLAPLYPPYAFPTYLPTLADGVTGGAGWDAIQVVSGDQTTSAVFVFRAQGGPDTQVVSPRGLCPSAVYDVTSSDWGWSLRATGDEVMALGLNCTQPPAASDLVLLREVELSSAA
jgi:hypothetical protein